MTPELSAELARIRQLCAQGTATREDIRAGITMLRSVRSGAAQVARSTARAKALGLGPSIDTHSILEGLKKK